MTETCDVEGCRGRALVDLLRAADGLRCRTCLETDLDMRTVKRWQRHDV